MTEKIIVKMLFRYLIGLWFCCFFVFSAQATPIIDDDSSAQKIENMEFMISMFRTDDTDHAPEFIDNEQWQPLVEVNSSDIPLGSTLWLKFQVESGEQVDDTWLLVMRLANIQRSRLFFRDLSSNEIWSSKPIGLRYPFVERYEHSRHIAFPVDVEPNKTYEAILEVNATNLVLTPLMLIKQKEFNAANTPDLIAMGLVVGSLTVMLLYNIGVLTVLREKTYLYYCVYVFSALLYILFLTGIAQLFIWPDQKYLLNHGTYLFAATTFLTATIFFRQFLDLRSYGGWQLIVNNCIIASWVVIILLYLFYESRYMAALTGLNAIVTTISGIIISVYLALQKNRLAIIYLVAWAFLMWGTFAFILMIRGVIEYNVMAAYSQMLGMVIELVLLSYALAYRINLDREQADIAQKEALVLAKRVSTERRRRIVAQEETLSLQRNINEKLEKQVDLRTKQLEDAMDKLEVANADLTKLSLTDQLSQVYNRRGFDESIVNECSRARRERQNLAMVIVDIDHFKNINDTHGHTVGDTCIKEIASLLKRVVHRSTDLVARYGGEEFAYLLPNTNLDDAFSVAEKARQEVEKLVINTEGVTLNVTASFGVASWVPERDDDYKLLIKASDNALYQAKENGRNQVRSLNRDDLN